VGLELVARVLALDVDVGRMRASHQALPPGSAMTAGTWSCSVAGQQMPIGLLLGR
jgi:hypothetical protein